MSYRERITAEAQRQLWAGDDYRERRVTDAQISALRVDDVDVSPTTPDTFLMLNCSLPVDPEASNSTITPDIPVWRTRVLLDQRAALRLLFNGLLDETNVPRPPRRSQRDTTAALNQRVYEQLRRSADDQR